MCYALLLSQVLPLCIGGHLFVWFLSLTFYIELDEGRDVASGVPGTSKKALKEDTLLPLGTILDKLCFAVL